MQDVKFRSAGDDYANGPRFRGSQKYGYKKNYARIIKKTDALNQTAAGNEQRKLATLKKTI